MAREEVKARLAPVPVYTVANPKNEFVLVAGEVRHASLPLHRPSQGTRTHGVVPGSAMGVQGRCYPALIMV